MSKKRLRETDRTDESLNDRENTHRDSIQAPKVQRALWTGHAGVGI